MGRPGCVKFWFGRGGGGKARLLDGGIPLHVFDLFATKWTEYLAFVAVNNCRVMLCTRPDGGSRQRTRLSLVIEDRAGGGC